MAIFLPVRALCSGLFRLRVLSADGHIIQFSTPFLNAAFCPGTLGTPRAFRPWGYSYTHGSSLIYTRYVQPKGSSRLPHWIPVSSSYSFWDSSPMRPPLTT